MKRLLLSSLAVVVCLALLPELGAATGIEAGAFVIQRPIVGPSGDISTIKVTGGASTFVADISPGHSIGSGLEIYSLFIENHQWNCDQFRALVGTICDATFYPQEGERAFCPTATYWSGRCDYGYRVTNESFYGNALFVWASDSTFDCESLDCGCL